jgi:hypothetical protein
MGTPFLIETEVPGGFMAAVVADRYHLKSIHEEIDLFDRKLAHLMNFEKFDSDAERELAARKMAVKRETLVKTALRLAAEGVEFKQNELPRSLRPKDVPAAVAAVPEEPKVESAVGQLSRGARRHSTPYTGTSLDWQASVREYMQKKNKE